MKIVSPPFWYMAFWILVFIPVWAGSTYLVGRQLIRLNEEVTYRATKRALNEIVELYGPLPLFHKKVGE